MRALVAGPLLPESFKDLIMELHEAYIQQMSSLLRELGAEISLLQAKVENAGIEMKIQRAEELNELRAKHLAASKKMKELETAKGEVWDQVKETADTVWEDLKAGVAAAHAKHLESMGK